MTDLAAIPFSASRRAGDVLYVSGQLGFVAPGQLAEGGVGPQTAAAIANIRRIVEAEGASLADVVKCTIWLTDKSLFAEFNAAYGAAFGPAPFPARSTTVAELVIEGALVEIEAIVRLG